jgi:hypothetical protein
MPGEAQAYTTPCLILIQDHVIYIRDQHTANSLYLQDIFKTTASNCVTGDLPQVELR